MRPPTLLPVLLVNFIGALGYSVVLPFLVFLVARLGGDAVVYGVLVAAYPAFQLVGAPVLGRWSDRYGRRRVLLLSQAGTALAWLLFLVAVWLPETPLALPGLPGLNLPLAAIFAARALDGLTGGNVSVAQAYVADISTDADRSKHFGRLAVSGNVGFVAGPALAGVLGAVGMGERLPILVALGISLAGTLVVALYLPESRHVTAPPALDSSGIRRVLGQEPRDCVQRGGDSPGVGAILRLPGVGYLLLVYLVLFLGFNLFYTAFPVHAVRGLEWELAETGAFFSVLSLMMVVVQGPVLGRLGPRFGEVPLILVGNLILGTNFALLYWSGTGLTYAAAVLFAVGNGLMWPSFLSVLARVAGTRHQGAVQGLGSSTGALASIAGLLVGGLLYERIGPATFLLAALLIELAFVLCLRLPALLRECPPPAVAAAPGGD
jgi:MFS family permease